MWRVDMGAGAKTRNNNDPPVRGSSLATLKTKKINNHFTA
jgi:hypothetical protein